ncbi:MAG TPA: serine/threonine-protein kinase [Terriglobales bacterium]|nr:serine/threonine-protein kinase [Terriglobales bacterium]
MALDITRLQPGELIRETYSIVRYLGSGAFGDVYLARHRYMGLQALKVFPREDGTDALEEAYLLGKLSHPNIVRMFEANEFEHSDSRLGYFSMEYVEGGTLLELFELELELQTRLRLAQDILEGLAFAHSQTPPVIHRDISPSNILVEQTSFTCRAKISDFGLAKHVDAESLVASAAGKYVYMAPESFLGTHSTSSDVYSAAIVLFELFTGCHPFRLALSPSATSAEIAAVVRESRGQSIPKVSETCDDFSIDWDRFFEHALCHDYRERPANAHDLLQAFQHQISRSNSNSRPADSAQMVSEARRLAEQADTLGEAIELLEQACSFDPRVRHKYADMLSLWKRGIVL